MRKSLLVIVALLSLAGGSVKAQTFEFQYQGQSLKDGATVTIAAEANAFGELSCETNPSANPNNGLVLKLLSGSTANVNASLQVTHNTLSPQMLQWCMGGECTPFANTDALKKQFTVNDVVQVQFDASNIQSKGYLLATLKASVSLETHRVNIQFTNGETANVSEFTENGRQTPRIYDLKGCLMEGHIPSGIYIQTDGVSKKKIVIK